ncbi:tetratricopeptide repeat protein [Vibrio proteolyticus]|uniref:Uncharacterized protein n=1 Tax=Vibrio proteolyticus NBRC 13287 TaxID=1219065 RepID=U2ZWB8_VIBPR|nr:tetratricopeptide repeat protein [Vibrio proteolyticus]GAD65382.1 hypothetical protein VPR01S_01_01550 [Vibrio proteolyticus NBRC 13287]
MKRLLLCISVLLLSASALAAELSQYTAIRLQKANDLAQKEQYKDAIQLLQGIDTSRKYDQAMINRMLGVVYWQNGNNTNAITSLKSAVNSGALVDDQAWHTEKMLADLLLNDGQYTQSLKHYYALVKSVPKTQKADEVWFRIAQANYQVEKWQPVLNAIAKYEAFGNRSNASALQLKLGAQLELEQWKPAIPTLKLLLALEPQKSAWWRQLVSLHLRVGQNRSALDTLALAKMQGVELSQQDIRLLAQLYAQRGIPERAAQQLAELNGSASDAKLLKEQAIYWQQAKEWDKAIEFWSKAAKFNAQYHWNVSQLLVQEGHYQRALKELDKVTSPARKADVALAKTRALYKLNQIEAALVQAKRADATEPSRQAKSWIKYLTKLREQTKDQAQTS